MSTFRRVCVGGRGSIQAIQVVMAAGIHLFPFRTEKLSPPAPMVLRKRESRRPPSSGGRTVCASPLFSFAAAERRRPVRRILPPENTSFSIVPDMWLDMSRLAGCGDVLLNSRPSSLGGFQSNQSISLINPTNRKLPSPIKVSEREGASLQDASPASAVFLQTGNPYGINDRLSSI